MIDNAMKVSLTLVAFDKMSKVIRGAVQKSNEDFNKLQEKIKGVSDRLDKVGKTASMVGGALLGVSAVNLKMAADFEANMANVSTLIDTNVENFGAMKEEVLDISRRTPVALEGLTSALYDIRSAGISADMQFKVLERSAQLGLAGLGSTAESVDLVTSSLNAFQLTGEKADKVYDTIFKTVKFGKTTISGIAQGFGAVAGTVAAAGVELDDYLAAVSALTTTGQPAAQAHTQIKAAIAGMTRESEDATKVFKSLGVKSFKELIQRSGGMVNAFKAITDKVHGNDSAILSLFGSTMAYNAVLGLTTKQHQSYLDTLDSMRNGPSLIDEGYQKQFNTEHARLQRLRNITQAMSIELGEALSPLFGKLLDFMQDSLDYFSKLSPKTKSTIAISVAGFGVLASAIGVVSIAGSKLLSFYGSFLKDVRALTPLLVKNSADFLNFIGLSSTAKNLTVGLNVSQKINSAAPTASLFGSVFADLKRIDTDLRNGISTTFKNLPSNISRSTIALKNWSITSIRAIPSSLISGLNAFKMGFLGIPGMIKNAIIAFRTFSITLLTSPLGWIALAIGAVALVIYKYWKPISAFFKGMWSGLIEGLKPVMPIFKELAQAFSPLFTPIKALINWFKQIIKPVDDVGGAAESMGVRFGKAIANIIVQVTKFVAKIFECGVKIPIMISNGIMSGVGKVTNAIKAITQTIRDHLPHSPAKVGPLKDLNKVKIVETVATTIKPSPLQNVLKKTLDIVNSDLTQSFTDKNFEFNVIPKVANDIFDIKGQFEPKNNYSVEKFVSFEKNNSADNTINVLNSILESINKLDRNYQVEIPTLNPNVSGLQNIEFNKQSENILLQTPNLAPIENYEKNQYIQNQSFQTTKNLISQPTNFDSLKLQNRNYAPQILNLQNQVKTPQSQMIDAVNLLDKKYNAPIKAITPIQTVSITKTNSSNNYVKNGDVRKNITNTNPSTSINYNPTITINCSGEGANQKTKQEFDSMLRQHKDEIVRIIKRENEKQLRLAY